VLYFVPSAWSLLILPSLIMYQNVFFFRRQLRNIINLIFIHAKTIWFRCPK
jgi:hypothetical protein